MQEGGLAPEMGTVAGGVSSAVAVPVIIIRPSKGWVSLKLGEIWEYRELLYFLAWRDIKVRYKQAALGVAWAVIQPLFTMIIFSVIFGHLANLPSDGIPYPVFSFVALLPWNLFPGALQRAARASWAMPICYRRYTFRGWSSRFRRCWQVWSISASPFSSCLD